MYIGTTYVRLNETWIFVAFWGCFFSRLPFTHHFPSSELFIYFITHVVCLYFD